MSRPIAVLTADVHYSIATLPLADAAMRQAIDKANELGVQLVVAGDLHDTKSFHRAECQEAMLATFEECRIEPLILVGNHCRRNERSPEHALHFLQSAATIIDRPCTWDRGRFRATLIPYQHNAEDFHTAINQGNPLVICHQGLIGAEMGHYVQDKSAVYKEDVTDYRVISGHYHRRQDIKCGRPRKGAVGLFSYIGNPYTLTFGEAKDPKKGFQILMEDGTLEFVPTNLRKHIVLEMTVEELEHPDLWKVVGGPCYSVPDLLWLKLKGSRSQLAAISKASLAEQFARIDFRLDKIPTDAMVPVSNIEKLSHTEAMDSVIDGAQETTEQKDALKRLYRGLLS